MGSVRWNSSTCWYLLCSFTWLGSVLGGSGGTGSQYVEEETSGKCFQEEPLLYECEAHRDKYEDICCTVPQNWAEHSGFASNVGFYQFLEEEVLKDGSEVVFYDSQCGLPLYVVPRGRTFQEWRKESEKHGWPSFRDDEFVSENLHVEPGYNGEIVSKCNTHLGHNFPDSFSNRHCINLMCMAGISAANVTVPPTSSRKTSTSTTSTTSTSSTPSTSSTTQMLTTTEAASADSGSATLDGIGASCCSHLSHAFGIVAIIAQLIGSLT